MASPRRKAEKAESAQDTIDKLERWTPIKIHRSKLADAPYNPRKITEQQRKRLRKGIAKLGVLAPPTWNVRTGNIVGGHQRIKVLDLLAGTADYELTVAQVDLSETEEVEANLLLNNSMAQGDYDLEKLQAMVTKEGIDLDATGFEAADIYKLYGDTALENLEAEKVQELGQKTREYIQRYDQDFKPKTVDLNSRQFFTILVFRDQADRAQFHEALGLDDEQYQDGRAMRELYQVRSGRDGGEEV